jgi:hypothetical protein
MGATVGATVGAVKRLMNDDRLRLPLARFSFAKGKVVACGSAKKKATMTVESASRKSSELWPAKPCDLCHATGFFGRAFARGIRGAHFYFTSMSRALGHATLRLCLRKFIQLAS